MSKPYKAKTTESSRRHAFASFRDRIEAIKIEPNLNLNKRAHDYVETSHLLATLEHWKEVNISGNFTECLDKIESFCQSLPQILHHKDVIFQALCTHIEVNDVHSIQPLLEMLAQFVHDLGPDFLPYYPTFLKLLTELALQINPNDSQNSRNSSNVLEWIFNCLAFTFKYLSRQLVDDLMPTFELLMPLLKLQKKAYISRFCAEALSFLIRKSKSDSLTSIVKYSFDDQDETVNENTMYRESMAILYAESMKNTKGTFHSKSSSILSKIIGNCLTKPNDDIKSKQLSILSDILLNIIHHGSEESCLKFYTLVTDLLKEALTNSHSYSSITGITQILLTLTFAESGRKANWPSVISTISSLIEKIKSIEKQESDSQVIQKTELMESLSYLLAVLFRNSDVQSLTKCSHKFLTSLVQLNNGQHFLMFTESCFRLSKEKIINFGVANILNDFISQEEHSEESLKKISLFLSRLEEKQYHGINPPPQIPFTISSRIISELESKYEEIREPEDLSAIYWRLVLLKHGERSQERLSPVYLNNLLQQLVDQKFKFKSTFSLDVTSLVVSSLTNIYRDDSKALKTLTTSIIDCLERFQSSSLFIDAVNQLILASSVDTKSILDEAYDKICNSLVENLSLPSHESRLSTIELLFTLINVLSKPESTVLQQIRIIEQIPLTLSAGRDISLRVRNLTLEFKKSETVTDLEQHMVVHYLFGLLTNKFQPCWVAVYEGLPFVISKNLASQLVWSSSFKYIKFNYQNQEQGYFQWHDEQFADSESTLVEWQPQDVRLRENFTNLEHKVISKYRNIDHSLMEYAETRRSSNIYSTVVRSHCISALAHVPSIAERNSAKIVQVILNQSDDDDVEDEERASTASWTLKDRNDFLLLLTKFKNVKRVANSEELYSHVLRLLCHRQLPIQKIALDVILNWGIGSINKYGDNLRNLLDDTIYRDEIANFITQNSESKIEHADLKHLMPLVLRILFGRAQGSPKSNSKTGKKFAVISVLPNFSEEDVIEFLKLGSDSLKYVEFFEEDAGPDYSKVQIRKMNGYVNLLTEVYKTLGQKFSQALKTTIKPLVYSLVVAQRRIELSSELQDEEDAVIIDKSARSIRQNGMKCLNDLFTIMDEGFEWEDYISTIYTHLVKPRMQNFATENLQQPSSLMKMIVGWIDLPNTIKFLYYDNFAPVEAIAALTSQPGAKESVLSASLEFHIKALSKKNIIEDDYFTVLAILVNSLLKSVPSIIDNITDKEIGSLVITVLLLLIEGNYLHDESTKASLLDSLTKALDKPQSQIDPSDKANILLSLSSIVDTYDCSFDQISSLYEVCSKSFRLYSDKRIRDTLVGVFLSIGKKFMDVQSISELLSDLNSYSSKRIHEYDFDRRLSAFRTINEEIYNDLTPLQWLPLIYCALFFMNDANELIMRTNGTYLLKRFVDCIAGKTSDSNVEEFLVQFKDIVLPYLKIGLRKPNEDIQTEYIDLLEHCVSAPQHFDSMEDMRVLLYDNDDEMNFFKNVNHIQLHNRSRAIRNLIEVRHQLNENSISHFILPIIEHYAVSKEDKFMSIGVQTLETIGYLVRCVSWNHLKAIFKRYIMNLKSSPNNLLKKNVNMVVAISSALMSSVKARSEGLDEDLIQNMPGQTDIDSYVLKELFPPLLKILVVRNDDTIVARAPLSEALCSLLMCASTELIESELPSILTSTCQVMRSRSEELRDAIRKSLCKILKILGASYLKFILQELKSALSRGSQIHVLSFTVHHLLASISDTLQFGDLNEALSLIIDIVMEDIFGAAGQEKDADGYHSKMKEVKFKKSFDTGEIVSSNINLSYFSHLLEPIKLLLKESISLKTQNKLDELLRRYALGLNHNEEAKKQDILLLCYEINRLAFEQKEETRKKNVSASEDHFLVKLSAKQQRTHVSQKTYIYTLQKFSFELLRTALSRNDYLASTSNLVGFLPLLEDGLKSDNEGVVVSSLRNLNSFIRLPFSNNETAVFEECAKVSLNIIRDSPTTNSEICQASLKFLATTIRHKPEIDLTETAIRYILVRIQPDLEEPNRQGLAFNFLKAVVSRHVMIPEVYDVMEKVAKIMVVNHAKEIRDMSRSVYYQFLMEYDQGRGKLEKQFKFLINNLVYPTEAGRQSVMELIHLVIIKSGSELLNKLAASFFVALANVLAADDSPKCREMATSLIASIFKNLEKNEVKKLEKYVAAWIVSANTQLKRCGFNVYKIYITEFEYGHNETLDRTALDALQVVLQDSTHSEEAEGTVGWDLLYAGLNVFTTVCTNLKDKVLAESFSTIWNKIIDTLLFPHAWIRLVSSRLIGILLANLDKLELELSAYELQTICFRLLRQLGAPSITEDLGNQIIKNLVMIAMRWESKGTMWEHQTQKEEGAAAKAELANDELIARTCAIMRQEHNYKDSFISKKSSIKLAAMLVQITDAKRLPVVAEKLLLSLFNFKELNAQNSKEEEELVNLTLECMQMIEEKLGVTEYSRVYAQAMSTVERRRQERRTKRAQMAINAPELAAKRKLKKHERSREKRKHEKDENGYYRSKKKRFN